MNKFDYSTQSGLFHNFIKVASKGPVYIFLPFTFVFYLVLTVLNFVQNLITCLFANFIDDTNDAIGVRVARTFVFGPAFLASGFVLGAFNLCTFIIGSLYDFSNKALTCGKSETYFIEF